MYEILRQSMLNLNHHIDVTGAYAGNARLFEATGVGTLLITDWKQKFAGHARAGQGGRLAIALPRNALKWSSYYLEHDEKRETIARPDSKGAYGTVRIIGECQGWRISSKNIFKE